MSVNGAKFFCYNLIRRLIFKIRGGIIMSDKDENTKGAKRMCDINYEYYTQNFNFLLKQYLIYL